MHNSESTSSNHETPSVDHFFFSCLHYEMLVKSTRKSHVTQGMTVTENKLKQLLPLDKETLAQVMSEIESDNSEFGSIDQIKFVNINNFNHGLVSLCESIIQSGSELFAKAKQDEIKDFCDAVVSEFFPKLDKNSKELVHSYMFWAFKKSDIIEEVVGDRPPVGIFTPSRYGGDRPPRRDSNRDSSPRGGRDSGRGNGRDASRGGPKGGKRNDRNDGNKGPRRGPRPDRKDSGGGRKDVSEADLLKEIIKAVSKLSQGDQDKVSLKPQNSYNRRRQHQLIEDEGYKSESEGQGDGRHVVIVKS
jgi:hypothetical protein